MVAQLLREKNFRVLLSRRDDATVSVEERVDHINKTSGIDLLVSIHANSGGPAAQGVETYCIHPSGSGFFSSATALDKKEYAYITHYDTCRYTQSNLLATALQKNIVASTQACNRGVKHAITRLLLGVEMPAVLIEVGYLSNTCEVVHLVQAGYQQKIARGICRGVLEYFNKH